MAVIVVWYESIFPKKRGRALDYLVQRTKSDDLIRQRRQTVKSCCHCYSSSVRPVEFLLSIAYGRVTNKRREAHVKIRNHQTALATGTHGVPVAGGVALRILALGDSITWGYNDPRNNSYRRDLECLLHEGGNPVSMAGSVAHGDWPDDASDSYVYHTIDEIAAAAAPELLAPAPAPTSCGPGRPNVVLVHAGTVDFVLGGAGDAAAAPGRLRALLDAAAAANPRALLVVARLIPNQNATVDGRIARFNAALPAVVASLRGRNVVLADVARGFAASGEFLSDGTHPSAAGSVLMARNWREALVEAGARGLIAPPECLESFVDRGATALGGSGRCDFSWPT